MKLYRCIPALDRKGDTCLYAGMLSNFRDARLKFVHPASLNNPLEAIIPYRFFEGEKEKVPDWDEMKHMIANQLDITDWSEPRGKRILEALPFGFTLECALMVSLSKVQDHPLMWAHYADNHRGICLKFDFPTNFPNDVKWRECARHHMENDGMHPVCGEVKYELGRMPIVFRDGLAENNYDISNALFSKPKCWEYEKEYRILFCYPVGSVCGFSAGISTTEYYLEYEKEWLTGITFGMRLSECFREEIMKYAQLQGIATSCGRKKSYKTIILTLQAKNSGSSQSPAKTIGSTSSSLSMFIQAL